MEKTETASTVSFSAKGQIVIPARIRREFQIVLGTKAIVESTPDGILLKPVTRLSIAKLHGILKRKPGEKTLAEEWAAYRAEEARMEEGLSRKINPKGLKHVRRRAR